MSMNEIVTLTDASLITCVVQRGRADEVVEAAQEAGAIGASITYGRGTGVRERLGILGLAIEVEKEFISIVVANDEVNQIFDKMFVAAKLDTPGMGFICVTRLDKAATYVPKEMIEKLEKEKA